MHRLAVCCLDNDYSFYVNSSSLGVEFIGLPPQGLGSDRRTGDSISLESLDFNFYYNLNSNASDVVRVIVFETMGEQPTGVPPGVLDILVSTQPTSSYVTNMKPTFVVRYDQTFVASAVEPVFARKINIRPTNKRVDFVYGTVQAYSGQLWYLVVGINANSVSAFHVSTRVNFCNIG
jgi:hypothetical protein